MAEERSRTIVTNILPQNPMSPSPPPSSTGADHRDGGNGVVDDLRTTSIFSSLSNLFLSERFSDMSIRCRGREFKAHCAIVCAQSPFFDRAITSGFQESASRAIDLPDDDPDVLERFLQFLYTGTYEDGVNSTWGRPSAVAMMSHQEVAIRLEAPPGVSIPYGTSDEENPPDAATAQHGTVDNGVSASAATNSPNSEDDDERADGNYLPPEVGEFNEPEEEYNEFYAESDYDSDAPPSPSRRLWHVDNNLKGPLRENYQEVVGELATIRRDLFLPLRLYVMADKFDVPALRLLARERFYRAVEVSWSVSECFPQVIDELYRSTRDTDIAMRGIVCRLVANSLNEDQTREKLEPIMRLHADFAVDVLNTVLNSSRGTW